MSEGTLPLADLVGQELSKTIPKGSALEAYMRYACKEHGAPPIYHLASALALACYECARRGFRLHKVKMSLWFALIGDSAMGKSTAINMVEEFGRDCWQQASLVPHPDPWLQAEGSIPGLLTALSEYYDDKRGTTVCMLHEHELSKVFATREAISEVLCHLSDGRTYQRHVRYLQEEGRRHGQQQKPSQIINPRVSALFATTEQTLAPHFGEAQRSGGIFSRLWWIKAEFDRKGLRFSDASAEEEYWDAVDTWTGWFALMGMQEDKTVRTSRGANKLLRETLFADAQNGDSGDDLNAVRIRAVEKAKVLAAIYALMRGSNEISREDMECAVHFGRTLVAHARAVTMLGAPETARMVVRAEQMIASGGRTGRTRRFLYPRLRCDKKKLDLVLDTLEDKGTVRVDKDGTTTRYVHVDNMSEEELAGTKATGKVIQITSDAGEA